MSKRNLIAVVARERAEVERLIGAFLAGGEGRAAWAGRLAAPSAGVLGQPACRCFCVQRYPKFLADHTIVENWSLPLWEVARRDGDEWRWLLDEAGAIMSRYTELSAQCYPEQLDDVARVAAQFAQAHLLLPDVLLLDAVFSGWHRHDRAMVRRMLGDYVARHPLRPVLHFDLAPPPEELSFQIVEAVAP